MGDTDKKIEEVVQENIKAMAYDKPFEGTKQDGEETKEKPEQGVSLGVRG